MTSSNAISNFIITNNLFDVCHRYGIGKCLCGYYSTLKDSVFPRVASMYLMPTYTVDTREVVGDCLYGPGLCDRFATCFRSNNLLDTTLVAVRL